MYVDSLLDGWLSFLWDLNYLSNLLDFILSF